MPDDPVKPLNYSSPEPGDSRGVVPAAAIVISALAIIFALFFFVAAGQFLGNPDAESIEFGTEIAVGGVLLLLLGVWHAVSAARKCKSARPRSNPK